MKLFPPNKYPGVKGTLTFEASRIISTMSDDLETAITWYWVYTINSCNFYNTNLQKNMNKKIILTEWEEVTKLIKNDNKLTYKMKSQPWEQADASKYLPTTPLAFRSTFNDSGKIKKLDFGIIIVDNSRDAG